jgi:uridine kinase
MHAVALVIAERLRDAFALVAIDGPGGSGKSTLAAGLRARLADVGQITVVHGDSAEEHYLAATRPDSRLDLTVRGC